MGPDLHESADLFTFTEEILNGKLHILCSDSHKKWKNSPEGSPDSSICG